jgi:SAM-dependent methyltransferase
MGSDDRSILDEQIAYYRARADEYDRTSSGGEKPFDPLFDRVRQSLRAIGPRGRVLELAAGTGQWTGVLAELADEPTATDASPEMLEINAAKVANPRVRYQVMDAFSLEPGGPWDAVFFGFFLSHVPRARFEQFWASVAGLLAPEGRVFFVDEAAGHDRTEEWADPDRDLVWRTLEDGTRHRAVKVLWTPDELEERLRQEGWIASVQAEPPFFYRGHAHR